MRARFLFLGAIALASILAACGGGGGGGGGGNPIPPATASPSPTASPTPFNNVFGCDTTDATSGSARRLAVGVQPTTSGAMYSYTGKLIDTIVRSSPCPVGTVTADATVTIGVTMTNATTETDAETDVYATNTDEYSTTATIGSGTADGATVLTESVETTNDVLNPGTSSTTTYGLGGSDLAYAILLPVPFTGTIANAPPASIDTSLADGSSEDRTYSSTTGAYAETDTPAGGGTPNTIAVTSNGAAIYNVQAAGLSGSLSGASVIELSFSAPASNLITLSFSFPGSSPPPPSPLTIEQWWSGTSLYSDQLSDAGPVSASALPSQCLTTDDGSATTFEDYERTTTNVDPALGSLDTRTVNEYVAQNYAGSGKAVGPVCVSINDTEKLFYDLFLDTPQLLYVSEDGLPFQTNTIQETYWFASAATGYTRVRADSTGVSGLAANVGAHVAGIAFQRSTERAQRVETAIENLRAYGPKHMIQIKAIKGAIQ